MINKQLISVFLSTAMAVSMLCTPLTSIHVYAVEETSDIATVDSEVIESGEEYENAQVDGEVEENLETTVPEDADDTDGQVNAEVDGTDRDSDLEIEAEEQAGENEDQVKQEDQLDNEEEDSGILPDEENTEPVDDSDDITSDEIENIDTDNEANAIASDDLNASVDSIDDNTLINISMCTIGELSSMTYTGKALTPLITIKDGDKELAVDTDYIVEYNNNTNAGTAKVIITGKGAYTGTVEKAFKITPKKVTPTVTISNKTCTYNGQNRTPSVSVKYGNVILKRDQDYTVRYASKCSNVGTYNAAVTLRGNYSGSNKAQYTILPKGTSIYNVVGSKDKFDVKWSKQITQVTGYQIQYSQNSSFASENKTVTVTKNTVNTQTIKKPTSGKEYYVRVRTYMLTGGNRYYSSWSNAISTAVKKKLTYDKAVALESTLSGGWTKGDEQYSFSFTISNRMISVLPLTIKAKGGISKGGVRIILKDSNGKEWQNDLVSLKGYEYGDTFESWFYSDGGLLPPGKYTYTIKNTSDEDVSVKLSPAIGYTKKAVSASIKSSVSSASGKWIKIGTIIDGAPFATIDYPTNFIIDGDSIEKDGSVYVWGEKKGTATVSVKLSNGKTYKTTVNLSAGEPDFAAVVDGYYTRDNYFTVTIKNRRRSDVIIIREGAKVENYDYKSNDRWVKADGNITVKYGETKTVRFYLKGSPTWPDYREYDLHAKFIFEGKTYTWHVWRNDSSYLKGNDWFTTYRGSNDF